MLRNTELHLNKPTKYNYTFSYGHIQNISWKIYLLIYLIQSCLKCHHLMYNKYNIIENTFALFFIIILECTVCILNLYFDFNVCIKLEVEP